MRAGLTSEVGADLAGTMIAMKVSVRGNLRRVNNGGRVAWLLKPCILPRKATLEPLHRGRGWRQCCTGAALRPAISPLGGEGIRLNIVCAAEKKRARPRMFGHRPHPAVSAR
jgi:hypothetical protein